MPTESSVAIMIFFLIIKNSDANATFDGEFVAGGAERATPCGGNSRTPGRQWPWGFQGLLDCPANAAFVDLGIRPRHNQAARGSTLSGQA